MNQAEMVALAERALIGVPDDDSSRDPPTITDPLAAKRSRMFRAAFPDVTITTNEVLVDGDRLAVHVTGHGTHQGVFHGCPPTGREWTATCTAIFRIREGHVIQALVSWDLLSILEQLGALERSRTVSA